MSTTNRSRLHDVRRPLLALHRALLDAAFVDYERAHGRIAATNDRLELVRTDPAFEWLSPVASLIVRLDEALDEGAPELLVALFAETRRLLSPADRSDDFGRRYLDILQQHPDVVLAHAALRHAVEAHTLN